METLYTESSISAVVELPSRGKFYEGKLPDGKVAVRAMTAKEEKLLYGGKGNVPEKLEFLLSSCLKLPAGLTTQDLIISDRFFLLIKIRMLSLGAQYPFSVRCGDCDQQFITDFDLTDLKIKYYEEDAEISEPFYVDLPVMGKKLGFRMLRGRDEAAIHKYSRNRSIKGEELGDSTYIYSFARSLISLDDQPISQADALQFVESMVSRDTTALRHAIEENDCGVDTALVLECPQCSFLIEASLPFTDEFFRPRRRSIRGDPHAAV